MGRRRVGRPTLPTSTGRWRPAGLWLRWSWRDLKSRWIQVAAIALVIALGTGSYAGLSSVTKWRRASTDDGYALLNMHDLRVELSQGSTVPEGALIDVVRELGSGGVVERAEERLIVPIQVDASTDERAILVPGSIYGVNLGDGGPGVDGLFVHMGRDLTGEDVGKPVALLERHFGNYYDLPPTGTLEISGGQRIDYAGQAVTP